MVRKCALSLLHTSNGVCNSDTAHFNTPAFYCASSHILRIAAGSVDMIGSELLQTAPLRMPL